MTTYQCKICSNKENNQAVTAKEMMFGFRDEFTYFKCSSCGCLQIATPPEYLSKYYPADRYYSYRSSNVLNSQKEKFKNVLKWSLFNLCRYLKVSVVQTLPYISKFTWLKFLPETAKTSAILDAGCGNGYLLQQMSVWGFKNLTGIDPFIDADISYPSGVRILKQDVFNHAGKYDIIMLHHSFEHMDNPREVMKRLYELLNPGGKLLIRIPVSDSFAWRKYGVNWFQLDAPRHFFLHTTNSITRLAKDSGFVLEEIFYDSGRGQFTASEKYCMDISFYTEVNFPKSYLKECKKQAKLLNRMKDGDQACFVLTVNR
jgi:SAM-dependent methyltransferase